MTGAVNPTSGTQISDTGMQETCEPKQRGVFCQGRASIALPSGQESRMRRAHRPTSPVMHWVRRYCGSVRIIRPKGWDAELPASIGRRRLNAARVGKKQDTGSVFTDLSTIRAICRHVGSVSPGCRLGTSLTDRSIPDGRFVDRLGEILAETGFPPAGLRLILGEGRLIDADRDSALALAVLIDWGIELWLGRFGQDVSSLSVLRDRAASGLLTGISLDVSLVTAQSGIWRGFNAGTNQDDEILDPAAEHFYGSTCQGLQALGLRTHLAHITSTRHYDFALSAGFDEFSGSCLELDGIAQNGEPPCS